jgi:large subunit ribosomal protein L31
MKADIHPNYVAIEATCSCGNVIKTRSTIAKNISLDVCSECHPFYTGKQRVLDTAGRVAKFQAKYAKVQKKAAK